VTGFIGFTVPDTNFQDSAGIYPTTQGQWLYGMSEVEIMHIPNMNFIYGVYIWACPKVKFNHFDTFTMVLK